MNREQIIKALECISNTEDVLFEGCAYQRHGGLTCHVASHALSLVRELTEENGRLRAELEQRPPKLIITKLLKPQGTPPDTCVECGEIVPEGRQVCSSCISDKTNKKTKKARKESEKRAEN